MRVRFHNRPCRRFSPVPLVCFAALLNAGCMSLQPSRLPADELRSAIRNGSLVEPGDEVWLSTRDGKEHAFTVSNVEPDAVRGHLLGGEPVSVAIDDIVELRTMQAQVVQTTFATLGIYYLAAMVLGMVWLVDEL